MNLFQYIAIVLLWSSVCVKANNCTTLMGLLSNLYGMEGNLYKLNKVFYPPRSQPPSLVHVNYTFEDEEENYSVPNFEEPTDNCSVEYIWAEGGFLLIQPPSIFQLTSLFFNQEQGEESNISLTLPWQCRELVQNISGDDLKCTCERDDPGTKLLVLVTQQLKVLAKYNTEVEMVRDSSAHAYSICMENIESVYHVIHGSSDLKSIGVLVFFLVILILPLMCISFIATIIRSLYQNIQVSIVKPSNHKTVAGMALMGMFVTFFVVSCDAASVYFYVHRKHELHIHATHKISFFFTIILLAVDSIACINVVLVLLYACWKNLYENDDISTDDEHCTCSCCLIHSLSPCFSLSFLAIFGTVNQEEVWKKPENEVTVWIILQSMASPFFVLNMHIGFVLVSWLTDTEQASSVALFYFAALVYLFFMLRQCYSAHANTKSKGCRSLCLFLYPFRQLCKYFLATMSIVLCCSNFFLCALIFKRSAFMNLINGSLEQHVDILCRCCKKAHKKMENSTSLKSFITLKTDYPSNYEALNNDTDKFNTSAFCIAFSWGWVLMGTLGMAFVGFHWLPIKSVQLFSDLLTTFQVLILLISILITYKIVSLSEADISRFLKKLRRVYMDFTADNAARRVPDIIKFNEVDDIEAAACLVADVVVHKLPYATEQAEQDN